MLKLDAIPEFNGTAPGPSTPATIVDNAKNLILEKIGLRSQPVAVDEAPKVDESADESSLVGDAFLSRIDVLPVKAAAS